MGKDEETQLIRILDVIAIGPLMIYAGAKAKEDLPEWLRIALIGFGATTIVYNGLNFLEGQKKLEGKKSLDAQLRSLVE